MLSSDTTHQTHTRLEVRLSPPTFRASASAIPPLSARQEWSARSMVEPLLLPTLLSLVCSTPTPGSPVPHHLPCMRRL